MNTPANLFQAQTLLGGYYAAGPWQESLKLRISGRLSEKLSVSFDLEQQQDLPDRHNVNVIYDKTELSFGDFNATFGGNEFASTTKYLNGVMVTSKDRWYDITFVPSSKLKSYTQFLATQRGNNTSGPYNIGHGSIIEGSEIIELNNVPLTRGVDYSIDYFEGKIRFSRLLSPEDEFKYTYEYTNIVDLFFPTVSKRDFVGLRVGTVFDQAPWQESEIKAERSVRKASEFFPTLMKLSPSQILPPPEAMSTPEVSIKRITDEAPYLVDILIDNDIVIELFDSTPDASTEKANMAASKIKQLIADRVATAEITISPTLEGYSVKSGENTIIVADRAQADFQSTPAESLAKRWKENLVTVLSSFLNQKIEQPSSESEIMEEYEWESTGIYKLKNIPVLPYSEVLNFKGTELKKFEDYTIDYQNGTITLFSPTMPTEIEPLRVDYKFVEIVTEAEILPGAGFGPYYLSNKSLIQGSDTILVNNIPYVRDLDYAINYEDGSILFATSISITSNIQVKYKHVKMVTAPPPVTPPPPSSWSIGGTFLQESGKRADALPTTTITESFTGSTIISLDNTINLGSWPLSTREVTVLKNGVPLTAEVDYAVPTVEAFSGIVIPPAKLAHLNNSADRSDGMATGTIKMLTSVSASDIIMITYTYYKWSQTSYTDSGAPNTYRYDLKLLRDIIPGKAYVDVWEKNAVNPIPVQLRPNSSIDAYDGDYSIKYSNPPYILFNNTIRVNGVDRSIGDFNFTVTVNFIPKSTLVGSDISHKVYGVDTSLKWGDTNVAVTVAKSETDQVYTAVTTREILNGTGTQDTFMLNSPDKIIEGSEQVIVNTHKLNSDSNYYFSYDNEHSGKYGSITFYAVMPSTQDVISITYQYQDTTGLTGVKYLEGIASTFTGSTKPFKEMDLSFEHKNVEPNFSPMGGSSVPLGSSYSHIYTRYAPLNNFWMSHDFKLNKNPINKPTSKLFMNSYDNSIAGGLNTYGLLQLDFGYRDYSTIDDVLSGESHATDSRLNNYSLAITPQSYRYGFFAFSNKNDLSRTVNINNVSSRDSYVDFAHTSNSFEFTNRAKWNLDYQTNKTYSNSHEAPSVLLENKESDDLSSNLNLDLTFPQIKRLTSYYNRQGHNQFDFINKTTQSTVNETIHADLVPIDTISASINHDRQETLTLFTALGNPKSERTTSGIQFNPYSAINIGWSRSVDNSLSDSGTVTSGWSNAYSIGSTPISEKNYKVTTDYSLSISSRNEPGSLPTLEVQTDTRSFSQNYGITYTPISALSLSGGYIQEDYLNKNDNIFSPIDTRSKNQTFTFGTYYRFTNELDCSANMSRKLTITPTKTPQKIIIDFHAAYKVFAYGTLNYDWTQEDNQGEIISGALADQNFLKNIHSLSLDIILPQTGETVLSSITVRIGYKYANFYDRKNANNSFEANTLTFEGSLNF